jgi:hypothetical protein
MTKASAIRFDEDLLVAAKEAARECGESFSDYVSGALRMRMSGARSILEQPISATPTRNVAVPRETPAKTAGLAAVKDIAAKSGYRFDPADCEHKWRTPEGVCRACGHQR